MARYRVTLRDNTSKRDEKFNVTASNEGRAEEKALEKAMSRFPGTIWKFVRAQIKTDQE
jgi:hypothetical protein